MTTITRERLEWLSKISSRDEIDDIGGDEIRELARIALASLTAEPVAWIVHSRGGDQLTTDANYVANAEGMGGIHSTPVYAAPPAPTVTFYRDGIESAAAWVNKQREEYDNEHGRHDPDTGTFEFGNDAQRDYSATLEEIAEGIRSLHPNTAPPSPIVPDIDRRAIADKVYGKCMRIPGATFYNAAEFALDEAESCRAAMLQDSQPVSNRDELREKVRREHAEWSDKTFGNVGPVGPLKHLSKEALEAAADPSDSLEWADMQFLLWDAQRRMGLSDDFITRAMIEKLAINKTRQWPEPKDGEPRLHIKEAGNSPVIPDCWCHTCRPVTMGDMRFVVCPECGNKRCPHANDHRNACTGSNEPGQEGSAYPSAPQQEAE